MTTTKQKLQAIIADGLEGEDLLIAVDDALIAVEPAYPAHQDRLYWNTIKTVVSRPVEWSVSDRSEWIGRIEDLCEHFGADTPSGLNRRIYKDTDCGASISIYLSDGSAYNNGDAWPEVDEIERIGLASFTIQTIVEGSDATVDSDPFTIPCRVSEVDAWMEEMEAEASRLWDEANGEESEEE